MPVTGRMMVRQARIAMPDGVTLAATLYLPADTASQPVPALLEYLPYRKDDAMLARDHNLYAYMTRHGYAGRVVDEEFLRYEVHDAKPASACARGEARTEIHLAERLVLANSTLDLGGDESWLHYRFRRELRCNGQLVRERCWQRRFPREGH